VENSIFNRVKKQYKRLYRFVIMDDATFEEKVVFRLTPRLFGILSVSLTILLIILTIMLIAFTPLREYIPGYGSEQSNHKMFLLQTKTDSLTKLISEIKTYEQDIKTVLTGGFFKDDTVDNTQETSIVTGKKEFAFSEYDTVLMQVKTDKEVNLSKNNSANIKNDNDSPDLLFAPVLGTIQQQYTSELRAIKILSARGNAVFASLAGTVIYVDYNLKSGTCIMMLHSNNIVTVYQNAGSPIVNVGDYVKSKQMIAMLDSEVLTFALWVNGSAVNPEKYIVF